MLGALLTMRAGPWPLHSFSMGVHLLASRSAQGQHAHRTPADPRPPLCSGCELAREVPVSGLVARPCPRWFLYAHQPLGRSLERALADAQSRGISKHLGTTLQSRAKMDENTAGVNPSRHRPASLDEDIQRLQQRLLEAAAEGSPRTPEPPERLKAALPLESAKIPPAFQREVFRISDTRLASTDAQAGILIAVAVAVATFTGGLARDGGLHLLGLLVTGALAIVVTVLALYARRERPTYPGKRGIKMQLAGELARVRVNQVHDLLRIGGSLDDATGAALAECNAWHVLSDSITT